MRLIILFVLLISLAGCTYTPELGTIIHPEGNDAFGVILNDEQPYYVYQERLAFPLVKDPRILGRWITNDEVITSIEITDDNRIVFSDVLQLKWKWIYQDVLLIYNDNYHVLEVLKFEIEALNQVSFVLTSGNNIVEFEGVKITF